MKRLPEAEWLQAEDKPSPVIAWAAASFIAGMTLIAIIAGFALVGGE